LLRLVVEERDAADASEWRGHVQHVGSGYERQFENLDDLIAFVGQQLFREYGAVGAADEVLGNE